MSTARIAVAAVTVAAIAAVAAGCGSSGSGSSTSTTASGSGMKTSAATVATKQVSGVGSVLVTSNGMALYTPVQEANGMIHCTGSCTAIWVPLTPGASKVTASGNAGTLAVLRRPDGTKQVTVDGKPVYTFAEDSPGQVNGNGASDSFNGQSFTWHAVLAGGKPASGSASTSTTGGGASYGGGGY